MRKVAVIWIQLKKIMSDYKKILFLLILSSFVYQNQSLKRKSLTELYENGKNSYLENSWESCVTNFQKAIKAYQSYIEINVKCKKKCKKVPETDLILLAENSDEELAFFEKGAFINHMDKSRRKLDKRRQKM